MSTGFAVSSGVNGKCLIATRDFEPGEVVFTEQPMLVADPSILTEQEKSFVNQRVHQSDFQCADIIAFLKAFINADSEIKERVLSRYCPLMSVARTSRMYMQVSRVAYDYAAEIWCVPSGLRLNSINRAAWVMLANNHKFVADSTCTVDCEIDSALLFYGSMLNHSCDPNCKFSNTGTTFTFTAVLPIRTGDEITIAYTDCAMPAVMRRKTLLESHLFDCRCGSCRLGIDKFRLCKCLLTAECCGTMELDLETETWNCSTCKQQSGVGARFDAEQSALDLCFQILNHESRLSISSGMREVTKLVGTWHYAYRKLQLTYLKGLKMLQSANPDNINPESSYKADLSTFKSWVSSLNLTLELQNRLTHGL